MFLKRFFSALSLPKANSTSVKRTHLISNLNETLVRKEVTLAGWVSAIRRVSKNLIFLVLRDHSGSVQVTLTRTHVPDEIFLPVQAAIEAGELSNEAVIRLKGSIQPRPIGQSNSEMSTGAIEIFPASLQILNRVHTKLPFTLKESPAEDVRLQFRYLDLRREEMQRVLRLRSQINQTLRNFFISKGQSRLQNISEFLLILFLDFVEIETPLLFKSTPEGAKEFLVPRPNNTAYALPQSPQQFKQLLMIGGFDKYFQLARCFRDEGMRADRQPEFTQLDMEMAFVQQEDVMAVMEEAVSLLWKQFKGTTAIGPIPRMSYDQAMSEYGSDKPDLRFQGKLITFAKNGRSVLEGFLLKGKGRQSVNVSGGFEFCAPIEGLKTKPIIKAFESHIDGLEMHWHGNSLQNCPFDRQVIEDKLEQLGMNLGPRDCLFLVERNLDANVGFTTLGRTRLAAMNVLAEDGLLDRENDYFVWIHSFPLVTPSKEDQNRRFDSMHHPFTAPLESNEELFSCSNPLQLRAQHYDLVLNGQEIGGGSIRIHDPLVQERFLREILGLSEAQVASFSHLLKALKMGAPPHGGMALGLDRIVAILAGKESIRDVIAFPKTSSGQDLCFGAPN